MEWAIQAFAISTKESSFSNRIRMEGGLEGSDRDHLLQIRCCCINLEQETLIFLLRYPRIATQNSTFRN